MALQVYKERVLDVAVNCAREACRTGVKRFIHMSTAQVYNSDKVSGRMAQHSEAAFFPPPPLTSLPPSLPLTLTPFLCSSPSLIPQIISHEGSKLEPWTTLAQYHLQAERELGRVEG